MPKLKAKPQDFRMGPEHRLKIANSNILKCLIDHVGGTRKMSQTQVSAGLGLLKKVMPDLSHNEVDGNLTLGADDPLMALLGRIAEQRNLITERNDDSDT